MATLAEGAIKGRGTRAGVVPCSPARHEVAIVKGSDMKKATRLAPLVLGFAVGAATAAPITFNFTGTATSATGIFSGQGTAVTGSYSYDTGLIDYPFFAGNPMHDVFRNDIPVANQALAGASNITVSLGAITRSTSGNQNLPLPPTNPSYSLRIFDSPNIDGFEFSAWRQELSDDFAQLLLEDGTPSPPDGVATGSGNLTDTPITFAPNPSLFTGGISLYFDYEADVQQGQLAFRIDTITVAAAPEPTTIALLGIALAGLGFARRRKLH
jgi:PEP-CTERM motif